MSNQIEEILKSLPSELGEKIKFFVYNSFLSEDDKRLNEFLEIIKELGTSQIRGN